MPVGEDSNVSYTVKELLGRIDRKLDDLSDRLDTKASAEYVMRLESRVDALERTSANAAAVRTFKQALIGLSLTVVGLIVSVSALFITH